MRPRTGERTRASQPQPRAPTFPAVLMPPLQKEQKAIQASLWETEGLRGVQHPKGSAHESETRLRNRSLNSPSSPRGPFLNTPKSVKSGLNAMTRACHSTKVTTIFQGHSTHRREDTRSRCLPTAQQSYCRPLLPSLPFGPAQSP